MDRGRPTGQPAAVYNLINERKAIREAYGVVFGWTSDAIIMTSTVKPAAATVSVDGAERELRKRRKLSAVRAVGRFRSARRERTKERTSLRHE